jgi:hypothetical protein
MVICYWKDALRAALINGRRRRSFNIKSPFTDHQSPSIPLPL